MPLTSSKKVKRDVALVGPIQDRQAPTIRFREYGNGEVEIEHGVLVPLQDGVTPMGDIVSLKPDKDHSPYYRVEVIAESPFGRHPGPAQVSTEAYRQGWDRVFGTKPDEAAN